MALVALEAVMYYCISQKEIGSLDSPVVICALFDRSSSAPWTAAEQQPLSCNQNLKQHNTSTLVKGMSVAGRLFLADGLPPVSYTTVVSLPSRTGLVAMGAKRHKVKT